MTGRLAWCTAILLAGCALIPEETAPPPAEGAVAGPEGASRFPGSLRQEDVSVTVRDGDVVLRVTPLEEALLRVMAPDVGVRLAAIRETHLPGGTPPGTTAFLVAAASDRAGTPFEPADLRLEAAGREHRALRIVPLTGGWEGRRLELRRTESALYLFEEVDLERTLTVRYGTARSDAWAARLPLIERERARIGH